MCLTDAIVFHRTVTREHINVFLTRRKYNTQSFTQHINYPSFTLTFFFKSSLLVTINALTQQAKLTLLKHCMNKWRSVTETLFTYQSNLPKILSSKEIVHGRIHHRWFVTLLRSIRRHDISTRTTFIHLIIFV